MLWQKEEKFQGREQKHILKAVLVGAFTATVQGNDFFLKLIRRKFETKQTIWKK